MINRFYIGFRFLLLKILILLESLLALRIIAKFLKANPETPAIRYLYKITSVLIFPFQDIFPNINLKKIGVNASLDTVAFASLFGYLIVFFIIIGAFRILTKD